MRYGELIVINGIYFISMVKNGLLLLYSGRNILRFLPPLVISEEDVTKTLKILDELLTNEENRRNV